MNTRAPTSRDVFVQALADIQRTAEATHDAAHELLKVVQPAHAAADARTVKLTPGDPINDSVAKHGAKSFTVVNPYDFNIRLGFGGISSTNLAAYTVPPKSTVTLPISAEDLEVGADPTDLTGDAYVFVFLYDAPQPFFFAGWAG